MPKHLTRPDGASPGLWRLGRIFARYANFTFGGGSATAAVLHHELVEKRRLLDDARFTLCFALGRLTPGTNLLAFCTGVGWLLRGAAGATVSLLASSVPCTIMVVVLTAAFSRWQDNLFAQAAIHGAIAAAVAIIVKTCWTIVKPHFNGQARLQVILIGGAACLLYVWADIPAIEVLALSAVVGALLPAARRT